MKLIWILSLILSWLAIASPTAKCLKGDGEACEKVAEEYGNKGNNKEVFRFCKMACEKRRWACCWVAGNHLRDKSDTKGALYLWRKACDNGYTEACGDVAKALKATGATKEVLIPLYDKACRAGLSTEPCQERDVLLGKLKDKITVESIDAFLFYDKRGDWSENVVDNKNFLLTNTTIGEGSAKDTSHNTLVSVKLTGKNSPSPKNLVKVRIVEKGGKKRTLVDEEFNADLQEGIRYYPYFLKDTGCTPLEISAHAFGETGSKPIKKTIPFGCGE
jgi:hypothetical protein